MSLALSSCFVLLVIYVLCFIMEQCGGSTTQNDHVSGLLSNLWQTMLASQGSIGCYVRQQYRFSDERYDHVIYKLCLG